MRGDLNVAHKEIDLKNPKTNRKNAGFTDQKEKMTLLLESGFTDTLGIFIRIEKMNILGGVISESPEREIPLEN